ncbi:hypothetical protein CPC08DRAFT_715223 [Agrocybe pediades]|nr:hypothetical protein CPC08DRAFT_715223 [Agrocybe pediades]
MSNPTPQIVVDDTNPRIQYGGHWQSQVITDPNSLEHEISTITPLYGTLHVSVASTLGATNTVDLEYDGSDFEAHFRAPGLESASDPGCTLDGHEMEIFGDRDTFFCASRLPVTQGHHTLSLTFNASELFEFDYVKYSTTPDLIDGDDLVYEIKNSTLANLTSSGDSFSFSFNGFSTGLYVLFEAEGSQSLQPSNLSYTVDDGPELFFQFSNPVNPVNPDNEGQLLIQTPQFTPGDHTFLLRLLPSADENQTPVLIQSYIVQNSTTTFGLNLTAVPANQGPDPDSSTTAPMSALSTGGKTPAGVVAGSTIGSIVFVALVVLVALIMVRHRRRRLTRSSKAGVFFSRPHTWATKAFNGEGISKRPVDAV